MLLERFDIDSGEVFTFLPENLTVEDAFDFAHGGKLPLEPGAILKKLNEKGGLETWIKVPNLDGVLTGMIADYLRMGEKRIYVTEDALSKASDGWLTKTKLPYHLLDDRVYFVLRHDSTRLEIEEILGGAFPPFVAVLSNPSDAVPLDCSGHSITRDEIERLVINTDHIVVGAYDGEGYVVWSRQQG
jgi:hypothetical protein